MELRKLGTSGLDVSLICLGTMTWGSQNDEAEGHAQMDYAFDQGINFFDTAELYAIPPKADTQGRTEEIIGTWFEKSGKRDQIILASKVVGPTGMSWFNRDKPAFSKDNVTTALESSLKRLKTDYIDLYQLHWPNRGVNNFGTLDFNANMITDRAQDDLLETLHILNDFVKQGKIRHIGLSNETPWGIMKFIELSKKHDLPRMQSVQNAYSLLNRVHDVGMAEVSMYENVGLLAYSPLARGRLTGKYLGGDVPKGSSKDIDHRPGRYDGQRAEQAVQDYVALAEAHGLDPAQMAIAFVNQQPWVTSNIIGATSMEQLKINIAAHDLKLDQDVINGINQIHYDNPNPSELGEKP